MDIIAKFDIYLSNWIYPPAVDLKCIKLGAVIKAVNNTQLLEKEWNDKTIAKGGYSSGYITGSYSNFIFLRKYIHSNDLEG